VIALTAFITLLEIDVSSARIPFLVMQQMEWQMTANHVPVLMLVLLTTVVNLMAIVSVRWV
jgi:hypothetical protein